MPYLARKLEDWPDYCRVYNSWEICLPMREQNESRTLRGIHATVCTKGRQEI